MLWTRAWAHVGVLERRKGEASRFRDFERDGDLRIVDSLPGDLDEVSDMIAEIDESGLLHAVGLDPAGVGAIVDALAARGISASVLSFPGFHPLDVSAVIDAARRHRAIRP